MKLLILAALVAAAYGASVPVPASMFPAIQAGGVKVLQTAIVGVQRNFNASIEAFKSVNVTCNTIVNRKIEECKSCVTTSCENRAKQACKPSDFQLVLAKGIGFFASDIPNFFSKSLPNFFVDDIGGGVIKLGNEVGDFFTGTIGGGITDLGNNIAGGFIDIGNGIADIGKNLGNGIVDFGKGIANGIVDFGNKIGDLGNTVVDGIGNGIGKIGDFFSGFGDLFGRRRRDVHHEMAMHKLNRIMRAGEPGCDAIKNDASNACKYYIKTCTQCDIEKSRDCPGYKTAMENLIKANNDRQWLSKVKKNNYDILSVTYDPTAFDPATGGFKGVQASVNLFGNALSFTLDTNPFDPTKAGPAIAAKAVLKLSGRE
ncbi:uncharacterized protein LOC106153729 [Lingula anatina]|uniref:Uncharacterized protein LOC106153729 n=1 Tax=Lingula anatina TaxID=7574 RepID=A0A1S3HB34_LINAN|nr:uncharacterized protein LOC106153729 [Lingula anatina]|eukprot:XP_013383260.1 uncharacterized protein LOC106153729 [Lingula anatina]